ncbi:MAG: hypothetical protein Phyf2KO_08530 [Phycisphaerales bacterium]
MRDHQAGETPLFGSVSETVSAISANLQNQSRYAALMVATAVFASVFAFLAAHLSGGANAVALQIAGLIAVVSLIGLLPALVRSVEYFGLAVLGASVARMLLAMFAAFILTEVGGIENKPVWLGVIAGAGLSLIVETSAAIMILSSIERKKAGTTGAESSTTC